MSGLLDTHLAGRRQFAARCLEKVFKPMNMFVCVFEWNRFNWGLRHVRGWEYSTAKPIMSWIWMYIRDIMVSN